MHRTLRLAFSLTILAALAISTVASTVAGGPKVLSPSPASDRGSPAAVGGDGRRRPARPLAPPGARARRRSGRFAVRRPGIGAIRALLRPSGDRHRPSPRRAGVPRGDPVDRFEPNLRIPGPTALPPSVREAGARQMINHRGPEFAAMLGRILEGMKPFFGTTNDVAMLTCAGSGGLEAAIVNTLSPGDRVLGVSIGSFGDRFAKIAGIYGADVTKLDAEWGYAAAADEVRETLRTMPGVKAVLLTHNETSTGVMNPIAELAAAIRDEAPDALILVDSVSGLGAVPFELDAWGVDLVVTGSQKAWMAAPGLAMIAASERGWAATETATMPRFYLDLRSHRASAQNGETPFTPAIGVVFQVDEGIRLMHAEGKEKRLRPPRGLCRGVAGRPRRRSASSSSPTRRIASQTVTAARLPEGHDWKAFNGAIKSHGVVLAGGQGKLAGKIFRLGHLGSVTVDEILGVDRGPRAGRARAGAPDRARPGGRCRPGGGARGPDGDGRLGRGGRGRAGRARVRILVVEPIAHEGIARLRAVHEVDERPGISRDELCAILPDYDALVVRSQVQVDAGVIAAAGNRGSRSSAGPGSASTTSISMPRRRPGSPSSTPRPATRSPRPSTPSPSSTASRDGSRAADASLRRGEWKRAQFTGLELRGRTLGIVGLGKIGQAIAARAVAMEMVVLASDPFVTAEQAAHHGVELVAFDTLIERSDVITVHVPLTRSTNGPDRARPDRPDEARDDPPQRRPGRNPRRGRGRRRAAWRAISAGPGSTSSTASRRPARPSSTHRTRSSRRTSARRRPRPRSSSPRRSPTRSSTSSPGARRATRSTPRSSPPRRPGRSRRTCRWPSCSGGSSPSSHGRASGR